jgi:hypothetical protein
MDLQTGKPISRYQVTEIPMPPSVIRRVEAIAKRDGFKPHAEPAFRTYALLAGVDDPQNSDDSKMTVTTKSQRMKTNPTMKESNKKS